MCGRENRTGERVLAVRQGHGGAVCSLVAAASRRRMVFGAQKPGLLLASSQSFASIRLVRKQRRKLKALSATKPSLRALQHKNWTATDNQKQTQKRRHPCPPPQTPNSAPFVAVLPFRSLDRFRGNKPAALPDNRSGRLPIHVHFRLWRNIISPSLRRSDLASTSIDSKCREGDHMDGIRRRASRWGTTSRHTIRRVGWGVAQDARLGASVCHDTSTALGVRGGLPHRNNQGGGNARV